MNFNKKQGIVNVKWFCYAIPEFRSFKVDIQCLFSVDIWLKIKIKSMYFL